MSAQNEVPVRRLFEEIWNRDDLDAAKEIVSRDYTSADGPFWIGASFAEAGLETLREEMRSYRETYSDLRFKIERMFSEKNLVVTTWRAKGIVKGEFFTSRSGEEFPVELDSEGMSLSRIADGKIIENRLYWPRRSR